MVEFTILRKASGSRWGTFVFIDSSSFVYHQTSDPRKYKVSASTCLCRIKEQDDGLFLVAGAHNHPNELNTILIMEFRHECERRAAISRMRPKHIFEEVRRQFPDLGVGYDSALEKAMQRARQRSQPSIPQTFAEMEELIQEHVQYKKTYDGKTDFFKGRVSTPSGETAFIFISVPLMSLLRDAEEIHSDATFEIVPNLFYQLFTLHITAYGKIFPVVYVLMSSKTGELYRLVMQFIVEEVGRIAPGNFSVRLMISDFEEAILNTMQETFPEGRARGCWFHYGQAIYRNACNLGLKNAYENNQYNIRKIVKMLIALALLKPERSYEGFLLIQQKSEELLITAPVQIRLDVTKLFQYMGYWFIGQRPSRFSIYGDARRTNNDVEVFHRWLNNRCYKTRQNVWSFIEHLQHIENNTLKDVSALRNNNEIRRVRPRKESQRDQKIERNAADLDNGRIFHLHFLEKSANLFEPSNEIYQVLEVMDDQQQDGLLVQEVQEEAVLNNNQIEEHLIPAELPIDGAAVAEVLEPARRGRGRPARRPANAPATILAEPVHHLRNRLVVQNNIIRRPRGRPPGARRATTAALDQLRGIRRNRFPAIATPGQQPLLRRLRNRINEAIPNNQNNCEAAPQEEIPIIENRNVCLVCKTNLINRVFIPCGHVFCQQCTNRRQPAGNCFICRSEVQQTYPLFI